MHLTEKTVSKLPCGKKREQYLDDEVTGFGVRVDPNGRRSFFWFAKVNGTPRFRALGEFPSVSVGEARTAAKRLAGTAATWKQSGFAGDDPFEKTKRVEPTSVPTFGALAEAYIENHVRPNANRPDDAEYDVRWKLKKHLAGWTDRPVDEITVEDVLAVKNKCGAKRYLANRVTEFVRAVFNWSATSRDGKINFWRVANPAKDVESFPEKQRERFLQPDELVRFHECLKKETHADLKDFLTLALSTGARRSDIFSMRWADVQWEREVWTVPYPKNGESYDVQLLPAALEVLRRRRQIAPEEQVWVFPGVGRTGHLMELKKPWDEFRKAAAIPDVRVHDLRRTAGSYLAISGVSLQQIGAALGHKSLQSTSIYAKLHTEAIRGARESGQSKMQEMMRAAKRRQKALPSSTRGVPKLAAASSRK